MRSNRHFSQVVLADKDSLQAADFSTFARGALLSSLQRSFGEKKIEFLDCF